MAMRKNNEYIIPFSGLNLGKHVFEVSLDNKFFEDLFEFGILSGAGGATIVLDKKETMMLVEFTLHANLRAACARCNDPMELSLNESLSLIYKFGLIDSDDETLIVLHPDSYQIDVFQPLFELAVVSIPSRLVHLEKDCDQETVKWLKQKESKKSKKEDNNIEPDPRWGALKNLN